MDDRPSRIPPGFDADRDVVLDPRSLRALAHPLRLRLRSELVDRGPATATQLAARVGQSSAVTSYHLRQLAAHAFIEAAPHLGRGRERYWRAVHRTMYFDPSSPGPEHTAAGGAYLRAVAHVYAERLLRFADSTDPPRRLGADWSTAFDLSNFTLRLTAAQTRALARRLHAVCLEYRPATPEEAGTRPVVIQFQVMPTLAPPDAPAAP